MYTVNKYYDFFFQILFLAGLAFLIGFDRTFRFFFQSHKWRGTGFFLGGIFVVLAGWPMIGMIVECYGFFLLFGLVASTYYRFYGIIYHMFWEVNRYQFLYRNFCTVHRPVFVTQCCNISMT